MNWRRGLFRLWLVISIAWAIGVGVFALVIVAEDYAPLSSSKTIVFYPSDESVYGSHGWGGSDCLASLPRRQELELDGMSKRGLALTNLVICEAEGDGESWIAERIRTDKVGEVLKIVERAIANHDADEREEMLELAAYAAGAMLLVPILLLATSSAITWALLGFKPRP